MLFCRHGRCRPAQFLCPALGRGGAPLYWPRYPRALERRACSARPGYGLYHALSRAVPRRSRTLPRLDAGAARRGALALDAAGAGGACRGGRITAYRFGSRARALGPLVELFVSVSWGEACVGSVLAGGGAVSPPTLEILSAIQNLCLLIQW